MLKRKINKKDLFFSRPIRNAASASAAKRLPVPASFPVTAYSLTKAWNVLKKEKIRKQTNPNITHNHLHIPLDPVVLYGQIDGTWKTSCWQMYKPIKRSRKKINPAIHILNRN